MSGDYVLSGYAISPEETSRFRTAGMVHLPGAVSAYTELLRDTFGTALDDPQGPPVPRASRVGSTDTILAPVMARLLTSTIGPVVDGLNGCAMTFLYASSRVGAANGRWYHDEQPGLVIVRALTAFAGDRTPPAVRALPGSHRAADAVDEQAAVTVPLAPGDLLVYNTAIVRAFDTPARYAEIVWTFASLPTNADAWSRLARYLAASYSVS